MQILVSEGCLGQVWLTPLLFLVMGNSLARGVSGGEFLTGLFLVGGGGGTFVIRVLRSVVDTKYTCDLSHSQIEVHMCWE